MSEECWKRIYCTGSDSAQNSMEYWDYTIELECLKGQDDLQLAAEIGKKLLERNRELENVIKAQQSNIDDQCLQLEHMSKQANDTRELLEARLRICEQLELTVAELERTNHKLRKELREEKQRSRSLSETVSSFESPTDEFNAESLTESPRFTPPPVMRRRKSEPPWKLIRQLRYERQISKEFKCVATMTEDLFDDERNKLEILEASFLRELDRRLERSDAEIERLQEEISTLLIQLAESEGRARDEAEHSAELEAKINELTKLLTILTTPPDPRRIDERMRPNFVQSNELSLEEEFRLSGDFDDVSSGIQSDIDSSLTTRDVSPEVEERKVVTEQSTTNNSTDFSKTDHFSTTQGTEEKKPLLFPSSSSVGLSSRHHSGEASVINWDLKGEGNSPEEYNEIQIAESPIPQMRSRGVETSCYILPDSQKEITIPTCKDQIKDLMYSGRKSKTKSTNVKKNEEEINSFPKVQSKKEQNKVETSAYLERQDIISQPKVYPSAILNASVPIKPDELSGTSSNYAQNESGEIQPCSSKKRGKRRRKRVYNGMFPSKPVEQVSNIEVKRDTEPIQETSALTKPIKELLSVCKVVGTFAFCYMVNAYFEISGKSHNPISELAPPLFVVNDSVTFVGN